MTEPMTPDATHNRRTRNLPVGHAAGMLVWAHLVPVRFPQDMLAKVRERAAADDRSVSSWIRRAVDMSFSIEQVELPPRPGRRRLLGAEEPA